MLKLYGGYKKIDTPPSSFMDLVANPKVKTSEVKRVGARSMVCSTLGVEGHVRAPRWD